MDLDNLNNGHWVAIKNGNHIFIENKKPRQPARNV